MTFDRVDIVIAEDHPTYSLGIEQSLQSFDHIRIIDKVRNGRELLRSLNSRIPHLILMDIMMPVMDGITAAEQIKKTYPYIKIIFVTMYQNAEVINECMKFGEGYISKATTTEELINVINTVTSGQTVFLPSPGNTSHDVPYNDEITKKYKLTKRELELIALLKEGLSTKEIAKNLFLSFFTVETHRKNIIRKLNVRNVAELISFVNRNNI